MVTEFVSMFLAEPNQYAIKTEIAEMLYFIII